MQSAVMARVMEDSGPSAFGVKLGISTGRHSPEGDPQTIMVNAETKVHWFFLEGAYVLHHVHGRDSNQLQKDFDLYLLRPGRDDIVLNPHREIADYRIKKNDELQFRHKALPITILVHLYEGDQRKMEVNSGFPVMDIVPTICQEFGIKHCEELSLATHSNAAEDSENAAQVHWLDLSSSLNGQGIEDGDMVLLRKKFFILNDDVQEAIEGNETLTELLCHQIHQQYVGENCVGGGMDREADKAFAKVSALLHHIQQGDENISDEQEANKVMPRNRQNDHSLYEQIVATYYQERVSTLQAREAKQQLLEIFSQPQSILVTHFPVKESEEADGCILAVDSNTIMICDVAGGQLQPQEGKNWRLRDLRDTDSKQKDQFLKLNVLGSWHEFYTSYTAEASSYLLEAHAIMKKRVARARISARIPTPESGHVPAILVEPPSKYESTLQPPVPAPPANTSLEEEKKTLELYEWPSTEDIPEEEEVGRAEASGVQQEPEVAELEQESSLEAKPEETKEEQQAEEAAEEEKREEEEESKDETKEEQKRLSKSPSVSSTHSLGKRPLNVLLTPASSTTPPDITASDEKKTPTKSAGSGSSGSVKIHIPEYLGLDYRKVVDDYKLFHIVVMKQDMRTLLLNVNKPVSKVVEAICSTYGIGNSSEYYLWIPTGIQLIIEKYGGRPRSWAGKFRKRVHSGGDFAPRLDTSKTLADQYNFSIKPYLVHLRKYQPEEEDVDAPDESLQNSGEEWPDFEHPDVARYRSFYQSWLGVVQGSYPVDKPTAVRLAALLTHVYFGDRAAAKVWPPKDYDHKVFLPEKYQQSLGIGHDVERAHKELFGRSTQQCINDAIACCKKVLTYQGVFFDVAVPVKTDIMVVIPWNKMEHCMFGINEHGIFSVDKAGRILFTRRFSDIYTWSTSENSFKLDFKDWAEEYHAYTYQTKEIVDILELFIQMMASGKIQQAPARPPNLSVYPEILKTDLSKADSSKSSSPKSASLGSPVEKTPEEPSPKSASPKVGSPVEKTPEEPIPKSASPKAGSPVEKTPKEPSPKSESPKAGSPVEETPEEPSPKRSSTSSPTTYDALDV